MDAIEKVRQAEEKADLLVKDATSKASEILKSSKEESSIRYNEILAKAKIEAEKLVNSKREEGKIESKKNDKELDDFIKRTSGMEKEKLDKAVDLVVSRILENNGNS